MKKQAWIVFFIIICTVHLTGILLKSQLMEYLSKPLLVLWLIFYFLSQTSNVSPAGKKWVLTALSFSWAGDVLLMFQQNGSLFFLLGLSAFLIAHIFYIIFFNHIRVKENIPRKVLLLLVVVIYYAVLITFLSPHLGNMKLPVRIYGIVISTMLMLSMHMVFIKNNAAGKWMMTGAVLFVISDSVLAVNKFYQPFEIAGLIVILTYGLAQLFIVEGAIKYINSSDRR